MAFEIWDVVLVPAVPNQENHQKTTTRPCIIIEDLEDKVVICPITKQLHQADRYDYSFVVEKDSEEGQAMGLSFDSLVVLDREVESYRFRLHKKMGECPESIINKIEELLQVKRLSTK